MDILFWILIIIFGALWMLCGLKLSFIPLIKLFVKIGVIGQVTDITDTRELMLPELVNDKLIEVEGVETESETTYPKYDYCNIFTFKKIKLKWNKIWKVYFYEYTMIESLKNPDDIICSWKIWNDVIIFESRSNNKIPERSLEIDKDKETKELIILERAHGYICNKEDFLPLFCYRPL